MKLSARGHYGLRAMAQLARSYGQGPQPLNEIARREGLSQAFLEQIMSTLRRAGLVEGSRGAHGGYELSRSPTEISAGDIVRALEGPLLIAACVGDGGTEGSCGREAICTTKNMWLRLRDSMAEVLDSTMLADLSEGEGRPDDNVDSVPEGEM
ncbi:MAG: Rrf2 family transcriptional regulator [Dehalococcoidales bacterium]|nr:Rrf2 family transcriptional regulator [Dehalococcoidales bacterium]